MLPLRRAALQMTYIKLQPDHISLEPGPNGHGRIYTLLPLTQCHLTRVDNPITERQSAGVAAAISWFSVNELPVLLSFWLCLPACAKCSETALFF